METKKILNEKNFTEKFIDDLVQKWGYPSQAIKRDVKIGNVIFDVAIQKGIVYVQAFEFKKKLDRNDSNIVYQRFIDVSAETPFYYVIFGDDCSWKLYDGSNVKKEIHNYELILNYDRAIAKFFHTSIKYYDEICGEINSKSVYSVIFLLSYIVLYILNYWDLICLEFPPLSYEFILYICLIIVLLMLPSVVKLLKCVSFLKIGNFEISMIKRLESEDDK